MPVPAPPEDPDATAPGSRPSSSLHGRFEPGTRLGTRYRVVGLLGRGGMGEVYRADDLELNQSVALKFLPERIARSADDLARLRQEVRVARTIAHPNVCRTYDIAEAGGLSFVVMEYVDGEDLASVLRRLGRPTEDKALEIARGICLGLGAAHENGVIHRDLKPANIMIDGRGRVRITDFGIAGTVEELAAPGSETAGTHEYMAPEILQGGQATVASDVYALGLVLYEVFTGKRASDVAGKASAAPDTDSGSGVRTPSSHVSGIDPAVERVILQCLDRSPARRPHSAYAVYGALPGGDPLAAAVAAGETPSPALVASAPVEGTLRPGWALALALIALAGIYWQAIQDRPYLAGLDHSSQFLAIRAEEILSHATGPKIPRYSVDGFRLAPKPGASAAKQLVVEPSSPKAEKQYWRRWAPTSLETRNIHLVRPTMDDPPPSDPGSAAIVLDASGRLRALSVVPNPGDSARSAGAVDWSYFLLAGGWDASLMQRVPPPSAFQAQADSMAAWRRTGGAGPETTFVAAAANGRVARVETYVGSDPLGDIVKNASDLAPETRLWWLIFILSVVPIVGGVILAHRNFKAGRVDMRGGLLIGIATLLFNLLSYVFSCNVAEVGMGYLLIQISAGAPLGHALIHGVTLFLAYIAIEPYLRRLYPNNLVSWARLAEGRLRDPIIGRDILVAAAYSGILLAVSNAAIYHFWPRVEGLSTQVLLVNLLGVGPTLGSLSAVAATWLARLTAGLTLLVVLRFLLRNTTAAVAGTLVIITMLLLRYELRPLWLEAAIFAAMHFSLFLLAYRFGFLAAVLAMCFQSLAGEFPWSTDTTTWYAPQSILLWGIVLLVLGYAFVIATRGRTLFGEPMKPA